MTRAGVFFVLVTALVVAKPISAAPPVPVGYKAPRTEYGYPNLQGNWTNATITPFERTVKLGNRRAYTEAEANQLEQAVLDANVAADRPTDPKAGIEQVAKTCETRGFSGVSCGHNHFWVDPGTRLIDINGEKRTSIIVDPINGRMPATLPAAQQRMAARRAKFQGLGAAAGPEALPLSERCILSFGSSAGPPMLPLLYNNNYQIVQNKDSVIILVEMVHDARVIRIGSKHLPTTIRKWMGDSIGHYEGDTLVVETINFPEQEEFRGSSENRKVTERFTRLKQNMILYRFTVEDPNTFAQSFSGEVALNASQGNIYEYACHEGNYSLPGILAGERANERTATKKKK